MKKIVILKCTMISDQNLCPGDAKCLVAFSRKKENLNGIKVMMLQLLE